MKTLMFIPLLLANVAVAAAQLPSPTDAVAVEPYALQVIWNYTAPLTGITFIVEQKQPDNSFSQIATTTEFRRVVTGLDAGTQYCFRIKAQNSGGTSSPSNEACGTTPGTAPGGGSDVTATFTYTGGDHPLPFIVIAGEYECWRYIQNTDANPDFATFYGAADIIHTGEWPPVGHVIQINPTVNMPWTQRCQVTSTEVKFYIDGDLKLTVQRQ